MAPHSFPDGPADPGADGSDAADFAHLEISAGTLHLRTWDEADGPVPPPAIAGDGRPGELLAFAVLHATTGVRLGAVTLHRPVGAGPATVGSWVDPAHRGSGVARRAVSTVSRWAFAMLGVERLELRHVVEDDRACRAATAAGFDGELDLPRRDGEHLHVCLVVNGRP